MLGKSTDNTLEDAFDAIEHIRRGEAQNAVSGGFDGSVTPRVVSESVVLEVLASVDLNDEMIAQRGEVRVIRPDLDLATKVVGLQGISSQNGPHSRASAGDILRRRLQERAILMGRA
jgi:hypothetical protein